MGNYHKTSKPVCKIPSVE